MLTALLLLVIILAALALYLFAAGPKLPPETDAIIDAVLSEELPEVIAGETGFASSDKLKIWYESISPERPPKGTVLLLMGTGGDALIWPPKFVRAFVEAGYRLIRYDHRGTGMSDRVADWDGKTPYSLRDMAGDALAVLDTLHVRRAHLVGLSMGAMIAQEIAIHHPERAASVTLMMTSGYIGDPDLPGLTTAYLLGSALKGLPMLKYRLMGGERNLIKERIAKQVSSGGTDGLDIKETAERVLYDLRRRRGINLRAALQHQAAVTVSGSRYEQLRDIDAPALVVHGTADQLIPVEHGRKLVDVISGAKGLWLEGVGHVFPPPDMDGLVEHILSHLGSD